MIPNERRGCPASGWRTGYVILVSNPFQPLRLASYFWAGIQWISDTIYNHCAIVLWENGSQANGPGAEPHRSVPGGPHGRMYIVEALGKGVTKTPYAEWVAREPKRIIKVIPHHSQPEEITRFMGLKYDRLGLFSCLWRKITRHYWGAPAAKASDKVYCYELLALIKKHPQAHQIMPVEFIRYMDRLCCEPPVLF